MNGFNVAFVFAIALIATTNGNYADGSGSAPSDAAGSYAAPASYGTASGGYTAEKSYGYKKQVLPYAHADNGNTVSSSITYPKNKGEIMIHHPAPIIVNRPPTRVVVNHSPIVLKPAPVVMHRPPATVVRKVFVKQHPRPVKVESVYVNVVKSPIEKYYVNERQQQHLLPGASADYNAPAADASATGPVVDINSQSAYSHAHTDDAAARDGYQLVQGGDFSALANIGKSATNYEAPASY